MRTPNWADLIGTVVVGHYRLNSVVYSGRRQAEFLASPVSSHDQARAVSVTLMEPQPEEIDPELARIAEAKQLQHANVLGILTGGSCFLLGTRLLYVATEAIDGTLAQRRAEGPLSSEEARRLLRDLLAGLEYVHAQGFVYRSLDPETIVRVGNTWKLGDLGELYAPGRPTVKPAAVPVSRTTPPEASFGSILPAWDVWALGVVLQDALTGTGGPAGLPEPFDVIVRGCAEPDPATRLSLRQVRTLLEPEAIPPVAPVPVVQPEPEPPPAPREIPQPRAIEPVKLPEPIAVTRREEVPAPPPPAISPRTWMLAAAALLVCLVGFAGWWHFRKSAPVRPNQAAQHSASLSPEKLPSVSAHRPSPFRGGKASDRAAAPVPDSSRPATAPATAPAEPPKAARTTPPPAPTPAPATPPARPAPAVQAQSSGGGPEVGQADYLSDQWEGHATASGERFSSNAMSASHPSLPMGTKVRVTNLENSRTVVVRINDRGAFRHGTIISLTRGAAEQLGFVRAGSARVKIEVLPGSTATP